MSNNVYKLDQLEELAAGSEEFVQSMIDTFLEHTPSQLEEMLSAYQNDDLPTVGSIAHKIKPNIDLFQIESISQEIRLVEEKGKAGHNDNELRDSIDKVEKVLRESFNQMSKR